MTKNGFLQILVTSRTAVLDPASLQVRCSDSELKALGTCLRSATARIAQIQESYHTDRELREAYFQADALVEGGSCVVLYHSYRTAVIAFKGVSMSISLDDLEGISNKLNKIS
jgi:hypothetical protein